MARNIDPWCPKNLESYGKTRTLKTLGNSVILSALNHGQGPRPVIDLSKKTVTSTFPKYLRSYWEPIISLFEMKYTAHLPIRDIHSANSDYRTKIKTAWPGSRWFPKPKMSSEEAAYVTVNLLHKGTWIGSKIAPCRFRKPIMSTKSGDRLPLYLESNCRKTGTT